MPFAAIAPGHFQPIFFALIGEFQLLLCCVHSLPLRPANPGHFYCAAAICCNCALPIPTPFIALRPFAALAPGQSWPHLSRCSHLLPLLPANIGHHLLPHVGVFWLLLHWGHLLPSRPANPGHFYRAAAICCHRARPIPVSICCPALGNFNLYCFAAICCNCAQSILVTIHCPALENSNFYCI